MEQPCIHLNWQSCRCADCEAYRINRGADEEKASGEFLDLVEQSATRIAQLEHELRASIAGEMVKSRSDQLTRLENERLRAALKPFADRWDKRRAAYLEQRKSDWIDRMPDHFPAELDGFTVGDFRRASEAIAVEQSQGEMK